MDLTREDLDELRAGATLARVTELLPAVVDAAARWLALLEWSGAARGARRGPRAMRREPKTPAKEAAPQGRRPCGCAARGPHRRGCAASVPAASAPVARPAETPALARVIDGLREPSAHRKKCAGFKAQLRAMGSVAVAVATKPCPTCGVAVEHRTAETLPGRTRTVIVEHTAPCGLPCGRSIPAELLARTGREHHTGDSCPRCAAGAAAVH